MAVLDCNQYSIFYVYFADYVQSDSEEVNESGNEVNHIRNLVLRFKVSAVGLVRDLFVFGVHGASTVLGQINGGGLRGQFKTSQNRVFVCHRSTLW